MIPLSFGETLLPLELPDPLVLEASEMPALRIQRRRWKGL